MDVRFFFSMSYGVYIVTSMNGETPVGCTANSAMQITAEPATIAVSINHENLTHKAISESGMFALNVLSEASDPGLIGGFGFRSSRDVDKFAGVAWHYEQGLPVLEDTMGWGLCKVIDKMETETHTVFLGKVIDTGVFAQTAPAMTYEYYHKVIKGSSPKTAPTYVAPEAVAELPVTKTQWVCTVCGYIYEGDQLPAGFTCPLCGVGPEFFEKKSVEVSAEEAKPASASGTKWVCTVCGYVYEGDELPEGYTCPLCGVGAEFFEKQAAPAADTDENTEWVCTVCGYVYEGAQLPEGYTCPLCGVGAEQFEKRSK